MEYKDAIEILMKMIRKYSFSANENEAVMKAIGTLDWGALAKNRQKQYIQAKKEKKKKETNI